MFSMFRQLFTAMTVFFSSLENIALAANALSLIGKDMAEGYRDEFRLEQQVKMAALSKQLNSTK